MFVHHGNKPVALGVINIAQTYGMAKNEMLITLVSQCQLRLSCKPAHTLLKLIITSQQLL